MAIVWKVEDEAGRVLRERKAFRACVAALAGPSNTTEIDAAELIYGELVANTLRHAGGAVEARLELADSDPPVLVVRDHGPGVAAQLPARYRDPYAESGRGLDIVQVLARDLAIRSADDGGTVVRATLPVTPRAPSLTSC